MNTRFAPRFAAAAVLALTLVACGDDEADTVAQPTVAPTVTDAAAPVTDAAEPAGDAVVTIADFQFTIPESVAAGQEVSVTNEGNAPHTFSEVDGAFSVSVGSGESGSFVAPAAGSYQVVCQIHSSMTGTLVVG